MAYELVEEVLDHAPPGMDPSERLVLIVIAEQARRTSREADIHQDLFLRRCGINESGLRKVFRRLKDKHNLDVRVKLYTKADGRVMYAVPGRTPTYRLPPLAPPKNCPCHRCTKAVPQDLLQTEEVPQGRSTSPQGRSTSPQGRSTSPQDPPSVPSPPLGGVRTGGEGDESRTVREPPSPNKHLSPSISEKLAAARQAAEAASHKHHLNGRKRENALTDLLSMPERRQPGGEEMR